MSRLALVYGGDSAEREISLRSGRAVSEALTRVGIAHEAFDGARAVIDAARERRVDRVFNMLHGRGGEDGCLQGALALYGLPVTGSGVLASALTMDKLQTKRIWRAVGLPTPDWRVATDAGQAQAIAGALGAPVFVKPAREGSSVGMSRVDETGQLAAAIARALTHDDTALVERMIDGPEYTAAMLDDRALPLIRIATPREFYDFDAKYEAGDTEYHCPCGLSGPREAELQAMALQAFEVLGCSGWGRVDFLLDGEGDPWLLEANTVPGMTDHSLVPMAAAAADLDFDVLVRRILATAGGHACNA
ncbi:MAG: D-alanine--D-alanine ligase [Wenzhouxiangellaceae bacterium]|nr:D-alanine--D-alanine ligase [Wenzhouxiangellaceae bacterium]MBS3746690.1 D-alanine--D-alanine ligase [Wenzhouxiangellaceae bacterium]MBS3822678.1 D-alanine--D-alanine ligase [Wenzhouxiangellaceae bacterium]